MFAKQKLSSAIAIALGASVAALAPMQSANADSAFFPHVVVSPTVTTIVSVINTGDNNYFPNGDDEGTNLHYRLFYKDAADNTSACDEVNVYRSTSYNDIQTIDLGGVFGADTLGVLFNDPSFYNDWMAPNQSYALGQNRAPMRGYLLVDNAESGTLTVTGEAFVFEFANGATWGYEAYSAPGEVTAGAPEFDYGFAASRSPAQVAIMPFDQITTAFMVTPVDTDMTDGDGVASIKLGDLSGGNSYVLFDRDESQVSGTVPRTVQCVGRINAEDLLTAGALEEVPDGGWGNLWNYVGSPTASTCGSSSIESCNEAAVVIKLEYGVEVFDDEPMIGVFNNAFTIRPSDVD
ncbi:hypothetical protein [Thiocapsa roseopersicina]|uniref:Uncharacterized protein n=1 Tax=Thiocapsa roseopersicina TaxID=1058 RepID=A0A1H2V2C9_THIRO|nr:hypothetical protein [Thiocapsa roseopersicina]SDW62443.1 hypothetical protein SAMN05421783_10694 [Thiocapsa roseopersicina]